MEIVWNGRNNVIDLTIRVDRTHYVDAPHPLNATNKVALQLTDKDNVAHPFDSITNPAYFSTDTLAVFAGSPRRLITLILGSAGLAEGDYDAVLTVFEAVHTAGLVVGQFKLQVRDP